MNHNNQRRSLTVFLLLFQATNSLLSSYVQFRRNSPWIYEGAFPMDTYSFPTQQPTSANANRSRFSFTKDLASSYSTSSLQVMVPGRRRARTMSRSEGLSSTPLDCLIRATGLALVSLTTSIIRSIRKFWWCFPMFLALVPPYCVIFKGSYASMPDWWSVVDMDHIAASDNANWIIVPFLGSNIAYALSGIYLMNRFRFFKRSQNGRLEFRPTKFSLLGVWVSMAGLISTIFHSVQALGSYALAENLCYLDHAVAGSAILYFFDTCGVPSKMASTIGAVALVALVVTTPSYAWLHSFWHYLSAATATLWALDGHTRVFDFGSTS